MILKKNKIFHWKDWLYLSIGWIVWTVSLIFPQRAYVLGISVLGIKFFLSSFSCEKAAGIAFFTLGIWALDAIDQNTGIYFLGKCLGLIIPIVKIIHTQSLILNMLWIGYGVVLLGYIDALSIQYQDPYWFLKALLFPLSFGICIIHFRKIIALSLKTGRYYSKLYSNHILIWIFLVSYSIVFSANFLDTNPCSGLNIKHRSMYLSLVMLPLVWWHIDKKYTKEAIIISGCLVFLNSYFHCRLGIIGIFLAFTLRYFFLYYPKLTLCTVQGLWNLGASSVILAFKWFLRLTLIRKVAFLNTSFYERFVFWNYFDEISHTVFWFGMGTGNFWRVITRPMIYQGIEKKIMTVIPSHTHCLWLDLKLCFGCVGMILFSIAFILVGIKIWNHRHSPLVSVTLGIGCYTFIIYLSFFGIFADLFVLSWGSFSWIVGKNLYFPLQNIRINSTKEEHVPHGTQ